MTAFKFHNIVNFEIIDHTCMHFHNLDWRGKIGDDSRIRKVKVNDGNKIDKQ
jgi:hypothetical protein